MAQPRQGPRLRQFTAGAALFLFTNQIVEMIGQLAHIAADMARRDTGTEQAFGEAVKAWLRHGLFLLSQDLWRP